MSGVKRREPAWSTCRGRCLALLWLLCGGLEACAVHAPLPPLSLELTTPRLWHVTQLSQSKAPAWDGLLAVQTDGHGTRWSLFDLLGVPLARQILEQGQWRNDGLLPRNHTARTLFTVLLLAWTAQPTPQLHSPVPQATQSNTAQQTQVVTTYVIRLHGKRLAQLTPRGAGWEIELNEGSRWQVMPLEHP